MPLTPRGAPPGRLVNHRPPWGRAALGHSCPDVLANPAPTQHVVPPSRPRTPRCRLPDVWASGGAHRLWPPSQQTPISEMGSGPPWVSCWLRRTRGRPPSGEEPPLPIILRRLLLHNLSTRSRVGSLEGGVWGAGHREVIARPGLQGPAWGHPQSSPCGDRGCAQNSPQGHRPAVTGPAEASVMTTT